MHALSATQIHELFITGKQSAVQIATYFLNRIEKYDKSIGAFLSVHKERVLRKAEELDRKKKQGHTLGKLSGIPLALKDNMHIKGEETTCASKILSGYRAVFNATATRLLEEADALILGKTNMDEFAMGSSTEHSAFHLTKNPWDLTCSPGGSSGGSAAAVAARLCPMAFGSDTGGSIRQPAAFTGIVGFKPTYGRISRYGLVAFASSFDQIGPFAGSVEDIELALDVLGEHCTKDSTSLYIPSFKRQHRSSLKGETIGVPRKFLEGMQPDSQKNFDTALQQLQQLGAELIDIDLSYLKYSIAVYYIIATAEASTNLSRYDGIRYGLRSKKAKTLDEVYDLSRQEGFGAEVKNRILLGTYVLSSGYQDAYYRKTQKVRTLIIKQYNEAFEQCELIAMPTSPCAAFTLGAIQDPVQMYLQDIYTIGANLAGLPAVSVPSGFTEEGKPLGLQLCGPFAHDAAVLSAALLYEKETSFSKRIPPAFDHD